MSALYAVTAVIEVTGKLDKLTIELKPGVLSATDQKSLEEKGQRDNAASE